MDCSQEEPDIQAWRPPPGKCHSIIWAPFRDLGANLIDLPLVMIRREGQPSVIDKDFLLFAWHMTRLGKRRQSLHRAAIVVGLLVDYAGSIVRAPVGSALDMEALLARFLGHRFLGIGWDGRDETGLLWEPVQWATVCDDRRHIKAYLKFCLEKRGRYPDFRAGEVVADTNELPGPIEQVLTVRRRGLLAHLARFARPGPAADRLVLPGAGPASGAARGGKTSKGGSLPMEDVLRLIGLTRNPVHKAIFILLHFGGPRMSEVANMWVDDVLPASYTPQLFQGAPPGTGPLVLLAHPTDSTWTGEIGNYRSTRLSYLAARKLTPRYLLRETDRRRAGWKGMNFNNEALKLSLVFWADPAPAAIFRQLYDEILDRRSMLPAAKGHPYLFVCLDRRQAELGQPLKVPGIRNAYYAACRRAGLTPHRGHATPHRARGAYTQLMIEAGFDQQKRSELLHQSRPESERPYGIDIERTHQALKQHFEQRSVR